MIGALVMRNPGKCITGMTGITGFLTRILRLRRWSYYVFSFLVVGPMVFFFFFLIGNVFVSYF